VIDVVSVTLDAVARHDLARLPLAALCGIGTSVGPCMAPRYIALAALLESAAKPHRTLAAFLLGLLGAYATLGFGVGLLGYVWAYAALTYGILALLLGGFGLWTLLRPAVGCVHPRPDGARLAPPFVLGALSASIVSPCCTPVVAAIAGFAAFDRAPFVCAAFLASFALGHVAPLLVTSNVGASVRARVARWDASYAPATVAGALMLALAGYYGLLA
jgi:cytochrome c biogenesis protein CcdA